MDEDLSLRLNYTFDECQREFRKKINEIMSLAGERDVVRSSWTNNKFLSALEEQAKSLVNDMVDDIVEYFRFRDKMPDEAQEKELSGLLNDRIEQLGSQVRGEFKKLGGVPSGDFGRIDSTIANIKGLTKVRLQDLKYKISERRFKVSRGGLIGSAVESNFGKNKDIFLAHMFIEEELVAKLKETIEKNEYQWKEGKREDLGSISEDILSKIRNCGFFIAVMTKKDELTKGGFTTSSWLIEEKGAALAYGHRPLIMVEQDVDGHYVGFLQSDDEMIFFDRPDFDEKVVQAIKKIDNTYKNINFIK